jgi:hypothetical protein
VSDAEIRELAKALAAELGGSVISSSLPAEIGQWVRETAQYNGMVWRFSIPMSGATSLLTDWRLNPDGTIILELQDTTARTFWRGTFRPVEAGS